MQSSGLLQACIASLAAVVLTAFCSAVQAAGYYGEGAYLDADLSLRYDSNLSRASVSTDVEEDMVTAISAGAGYMKPLNAHSQVLISAYLAHENFAEFNDLNNIAVNSDIVYTLQPVKGYGQPWYQASLGVSAIKFNKSNIRDSYIVRAGLGSGIRLNDRILARLDYNYDHRRSDSLVFDTGRHELRGQLVYRLNPAISLFTNYDLQIGDVVSTATPNPQIIAAAERVAPDDVFSAAGGPGCMNRRCAYRLDAIGHQLEMGMEMNINQFASIDLSAARFIVDGDGVSAYRGWIYRAGLYVQF